METLEREYQHILLWMPNWIGDVVFAMPTVQALRRLYPKGRLTAVVRRPADQFLTGHPALDSVIPLPAGKKAGWFNQVRFAMGLRKYRLDMAIIFPNSFRAALLARLAGAKRRIGYDTDGRRGLLTDPMPGDEDSRQLHAADYYAGLVRILGAPMVEKSFAPWISPEEQRAQAGLLARLGIRRGELLVAVHPGASKPEKRWHAERFGILCQQLVKERGAKILLLGSRGEKDLLQKIGKFCPDSTVFPLAGLHLRVVAGMLKNCRVLVANDSGLMNLGAMVGTPVVAIFGPGHPRTTDPLIGPDKKEIVTLNFSCSPCRHRFFKDCQPSLHSKPFCIEDISVSQVAAAVDRLLGRLGQGGAPGRFQSSPSSGVSSSQ
ncbi:MAG: lipopolysaccharide heptosyltransferase II [Nitrospinaceae bacterium]